MSGPYYAGSASGSAYSPRHQLPPPPDLTGRGDELADLERQILGGAAGAAICGARLQGMGGVGKTAFAVELCHRLKSRWPDAQLFIDLRGADPQKRPPLPSVDAMARVVHAFQPDMRLPDDADAVAPVYRAVLADAGAVLLLLDDAADEAQVAPLLPPPNCLLIVTSRARFDLPRVAAHSLDCLAPDQSRELLLQHTDNRLGALADEAAQLCGHLPLALLVFAGAVMRAVSTPQRLVERLRSGTLRLEKVNAVFEVSAELLSEPLRRQWMVLSIFTASFTAEAAAAVWEQSEEDAEQALESLISASLVEWNRTTGRFRLHDLVRQFCAGKLPSEEMQAARLRHAKHYAAVGEKADELFQQGGGAVRQGLALFDAERAHLDLAFDWLSPCSDLATASILLTLVNAVAYTGDLRFHPRERIRWMEAQSKGSSLTGDRRGEGNALGNLGLAHADLGETRKAIDFYEQQLVIVREIGDRRGEGNALGNLGVAYKNLGETRKAIDFHEQALVISRETGDRRGESADLGNLGIAYTDMNEPRKAIGFYEQQLVIVREIGDRRGEGNALWNSAGEFRKLDEHAEAFCRVEAALTIFEAIEDPNSNMVRAALVRWRGEGT